jgi:hypothetical protein
MASSGIRLGAWDYLKWKHVSPITNDKGQVVAAKLLVYPLQLTSLGHNHHKIQISRISLALGFISLLSARKLAWLSLVSLLQAWT